MYTKFIKNNEKRLVKNGQKEKNQQTLSYPSFVAIILSTIKETSKNQRGYVTTEDI